MLNIFEVEILSYTSRTRKEDCSSFFEIQEEASEISEHDDGINTSRYFQEHGVAAGSLKCLTMNLSCSEVAVGQCSALRPGQQDSL
ncbi:hypothetical protein AV530_007573 [Patagioenas fasciata monilis]|uniref:Uncharacterized protein n=1 Tax=Patagioenas fasciata monilis TaxID=372326 RepID=A0A1V4JZY0_PATFA|nr:hypothetical protein AV530_007573 [Patagioenas fasciata monilis]